MTRTQHDFGHLGPLIAVPVVVYVLLGLVFYNGGPTLEPPCDRPTEGASTCSAVDSFGDEASFRPTDPSAPSIQRTEFLRVVPPRTLLSFWSGVGAITVTVSGLLSIFALRRWREIRKEYSEQVHRRGVSYWAGLALFPAWALVLAGATEWGDDPILTEVLTVSAATLPWLFALTAVGLIMDINVVARKLSSSMNPDAIASLRSALSLSIGVLGATLASRILWDSANQRLNNAIDVAELARLGGSFTTSPRTPEPIVISALVVTGLLALAFVSVSHVLDNAADLIRGAKIKELENSGVQEFSEEWLNASAKIGQELGLDQPIRARFENGLSVVAPLLIGIGSQLFPV